MCGGFTLLYEMVRDKSVSAHFETDECPVLAAAHLSLVTTPSEMWPR